MDHAPGHTPGLGDVPAPGRRRSWHAVHRRPAVRRVDRADRPAGRRLPDDPGQPGPGVPAAARRDRGAAGHGPQTTIGAERAGNPFLAGLPRPAARSPGCERAGLARSAGAVPAGLCRLARSDEWRGRTRLAKRAAGSDEWRGLTRLAKRAAPERSRYPPYGFDLDSDEREAGQAMIRSHEAGSLRAAAGGRAGTLAGWVARRRDHGGVVFIDLRDASGIVQVVLREEDVAHDLRAEFCVLVTGTVRCARPGTRTRSCRPARSRSPRTGIEVLSQSDPLPFPIEGGGELNEEVRLKYRYLDIRRADMAAALRARSKAAYLLNEVMTRAPVRERGDPVPDPVHPRGRARLPGAGPAAARPLVRAAAVAAAVQAAADDLRAGALLPARPVLPGRGLPGRPAARVHPDRHRDVVRDQGRRRRRRRGPGRAAVGGDRRLPGAAADPAHDLRRRDGEVRLGQAGPAVRQRAGRPDRLLRAVGVPRVPGPARRARWSCPAAPARPARNSTAGRTGPSRAAPAGWPTC